MAGDIKIKYGDSNQAISITLTALACNIVRNSDIIDNTSNLYIDALVGGKLVTGATAPAATGYLNVYAYGTVNDTAASVFTSDGCPLTDCTVVLTAPPNIRLIGVINAVASGAAYKFGPFSVAAAFGGVLPRKWGIAIENKTGQGLSASATDHQVAYQGVYAQYT